MEARVRVPRARAFLIGTLFLSVQGFEAPPGSAFDRIRIDDGRIGCVQYLTGDAALHESDGFQVRRNPRRIESPVESDALASGRRIETQLLAVVKLARDIIPHHLAVRIAAIDHLVLIEDRAYEALFRHWNHLPGDLLHVNEDRSHCSGFVERDFRFDFDRGLHRNAGIDSGSIVLVRIGGAGDREKAIEENRRRAEVAVVSPALRRRRILQSLGDVILDVFEDAGTVLGFKLRERRPGAGTVGSGRVAKLLEKDQARGKGAPGEQTKGGQEEANAHRRSNDVVHLDESTLPRSM